MSPASKDAEPRAPSSRWVTAALCLLWVPGILLRLSRLEWMEYAGDEVSILYGAYRATHEELALHGIPASIGMRLPSLMMYLLAIPMAFTRDPVGIVLFVALLNLAGVGLFFVFVRRGMGTRTAILAAAILACAPWPVLLSRKIWNPDFLFPFAIGLYAVLHSHLAAPRSSKVFLAVILYAALCQFHASAWLLVAPLAAWWAVFRVPLPRRGLLLGLAAALALWAPYLYYLASTGFDDIAYAWNLRGQAPTIEGSRASLLVAHLVRALQASTGLGFETQPSEGAAAAFGWLVARGFFAWTAAATLWALARSARVVAGALRGERSSPLDALGALLAACFLFVVAMYALLSFPDLTHYHAILVPLPLYFAVWLAWRILRTSPAAALGVGVLVVAGHASLLAQFLDGLEEGRRPRGVAYAPAYAPRAAECRAELDLLFADVDDGHRRRREEQDRCRRLFESADEVLLRFDPARNEPPAIAEGSLALEPGGSGLVVRGSTLVDMLRLPPFENEAGGRIVLRLEVEMPKDGLGLLLYEAGVDGGYRRGQTLDLPFRKGLNRFHFELPDRDARGRIMLRVGVWRYVVRAMEVRRARG